MHRLVVVHPVGFHTKSVSRLALRATSGIRSALLPAQQAATAIKGQCFSSLARSLHRRTHNHPFLLSYKHASRHFVLRSSYLLELFAGQQTVLDHSSYVGLGNLVYIRSGKTGNGRVELLGGPQCAGTPAHFVKEQDRTRNTLSCNVCRDQCKGKHQRVEEEHKAHTVYAGAHIGIQTAW